MSHNHSNTCSCCCSHYPDLLQKICPTRTWEVDCSPAKRLFNAPPRDSPHRRSHGCKCCSKNKKVKGKFGVAWICETPNCSCCEPFGWQVEFCDTPSKVEQRCREMIEWVNKPPLPKNEDNNSKGESCRCKKEKQEKQQRCCCMEPKPPVRCRCREQRICNCESEEIDNEGGYCPCNTNTRCCCQDDDDDDDDDEIPVKDTAKQPTITVTTTSSKGNTTDESEMKQERAVGSPTRLNEPQNARSTPEVIKAEPEVGRGAAPAARTPTEGAREEGKMRAGGAGADAETAEAFFSYNKPSLIQVGERGAIVQRKNETKPTKNRKHERNDKETCECIARTRKKKCGGMREIPVECRRTVEYRCCPSEKCLPLAKRKRRIWFPAQVTRLVLRNLKSYVNNTLYRQSCECNDAIDVVCANKDVC